VRKTSQELVRPVALALEVRPVTGRGGLDPGKLGFQQFDVRFELGRDR
jgi:hypothetical protein